MPREKASLSQKTDHGYDTEEDGDRVTTRWQPQSPTFVASEVVLENGGYTLLRGPLNEDVIVPGGLFGRGLERTGVEVH